MVVWSTVADGVPRALDDAAPAWGPSGHERPPSCSRRAFLQATAASPALLMAFSSAPALATVVAGAESWSDGTFWDDDTGWR